MSSEHFPYCIVIGQFPKTFTTVRPPHHVHHPLYCSYQKKFCAGLLPQSENDSELTLNLQQTTKYIISKHLRPMHAAIIARGRSHQMSYDVADYYIVHKATKNVCCRTNDFNSYSASRDNWCTATLWNRIMTAQCEGMGEVGSARYEPALLAPCPNIRALCYSNSQRSTQSH